MTTLKSLCGSQQTVENSSREGIQDHLTYFLRNLYAGQTAAVRTGHGAMDWIKTGKEVTAVHCDSNFYAEYIMQKAGLD